MALEFGPPKVERAYRVCHGYIDDEATRIGVPEVKSIQAAIEFLAERIPQLQLLVFKD